MQIPKLTFNKAIIITAIINIVIYNYLQENRSTNTYKNGDSYDIGSSDVFLSEKSQKLSRRIISEIENDIPATYLKQKKFISNVSIYTFQDNDSNIYASHKNEAFFIDQISNSQLINNRNFKVFFAPVKIELIKVLDVTKSYNPIFKALLENTVEVNMTFEDLLDLTKTEKEAVALGKLRPYPSMQLFCPYQENNLGNKTQSLERMGNVIKHAPFMKNIIDIERFKSKSDKTSIFFCFWLKFSSNEEYIKSKLLIKAFAPEYKEGETR